MIHIICRLILHGSTVDENRHSVFQFHLHASSINIKFILQDFHCHSSLNSRCSSLPVRRNLVELLTFPHLYFLLGFESLLMCLFLLYQMPFTSLRYWLYLVEISLIEILSTDFFSYSCTLLYQNAICEANEYLIFNFTYLYSWDGYLMIAIFPSYQYLK